MKNLKNRWLMIGLSFFIGMDAQDIDQAIPGGVKPQVSNASVQTEEEAAVGNKSIVDKQSTMAIPEKQDKQDPKKDIDQQSIDIKQSVTSKEAANSNKEENLTGVSKKDTKGYFTLLNQFFQEGDDWLFDFCACDKNSSVRSYIRPVTMTMVASCSYAIYTMYQQYNKKTLRRSYKKKI